MKKLGILLGIAALVLSITPVLAKGPSAPAGNSNKGQLYLYEKTPSGLWPIVDKGAWGKMTYDLTGPKFSYVFNGHQLVAGEKYTLIYYPDKYGDPWPRTGILCLGNGVANDGNELNIQNALFTGTLPTPKVDIKAGAKIWLVKSGDVSCETTWNVVGTWKWLVLGTYSHDITITTQNLDGTFSGIGGYPAGGSPYTGLGQTTETIIGQVVGDDITFTTTYAGSYNPGYFVTVSGTIASGGSMSGNSPWEWHTTEGKATKAAPGTMSGWNPTEYLFEGAPIKFTQLP